MSERPHVLIVDDDREIRGLLAQYLEKHDFRTTAVADGREMRRTLERSHVDLLVLDLMLPGEDGLSLCRSIRETSQIPVILLTARGEEVDRIIGLEMGADDYIAKPFSPRELIARVAAVLRRTQALPPRQKAPPAERVKFGDWIEKNLLNINTMDLKQVHINDYSIETVVDKATNRAYKMPVPHGEYRVDVSSGDQPWKLVEDFGFVLRLLVLGHPSLQQRGGAFDIYPLSKTLSEYVCTRF